MFQPDSRKRTLVKTSLYIVCAFKNSRCRFRLRWGWQWKSSRAEVRNKRLLHQLACLLEFSKLCLQRKRETAPKKLIETDGFYWRYFGYNIGRDQ